MKKNHFIIKTYLLSIELTLKNNKHYSALYTINYKFYQMEITNIFMSFGGHRV